MPHYMLHVANETTVPHMLNLPSRRDGTIAALGKCRSRPRRLELSELARSLLRWITSSFRHRTSAANDGGQRNGNREQPGRQPPISNRRVEQKSAEARIMARLIAEYLHELHGVSNALPLAESAKSGVERRGNTRKRANRAAKADARRTERTFNVVSFPKSGRTWLRVMLDDLRLDAKYTHDGSDHSRTGHVEELQPASQAFAGKIVVFLYRDPRDTAVSGYFQASKRLNSYTGTISDFIRDPRHGIEKIARFNMEWLERGPVLGTFLPVTYEELRRDTVGTLSRIIAFVGAERSEDSIRSSIDEASFEKLKQKEASGELAERYGKALLPGDTTDPQSYKVREGLVGGFRKHLSDADVSYCDEVLHRLGYPLERHALRAA